MADPEARSEAGSKIPSHPGAEAARLAALRESGLLDSAPEVAFDDIARLAARLCEAPYAMVGLVDVDRTWCKAQVGFAELETSRPASLCELVLEGPLVIEDTLANSGFAEHALVTTPPHVRFFAGEPIRTAAGHAIGALCVFDVRPRPLTPEQEYGLRALAQTATRQIDLHRHARAIETLLAERTALLRVADLVGGVADATERLRRICRELARLTGADTASAYMLDPSGAFLQPVAAYRVPKWALEGLAQTSIPADAEGFAAIALQQCQVVWSGDVAGDARFPQAVVRQFPHRSGIVVPMVVDDVVIGGFYLTWWERARTVTDTEAALLRTVGLHVGLFLRSARLNAELEARNARLRTLIQLNQEVSSTLDASSTLTSIARAAEQLMDADQVAVWTADERRRRLTLAAVSRVLSVDFPQKDFGYDEAATGWVATQREVLKIDDVYAEGSPILHPERWRREGLRTFLGVPVILDGELLAVLAMAGQRPFLRGPGDRDLVDMFASQTAVALHNASLHAEALEARRAAEAAARATSDFVSMMSHEVRTPLTGVVGAAQLLRATALGPEQHELVETLQHSAEALRDVVGDVLDLAKIEAGKLDLEAVDFEPRALVEAAVDGFAHAAESKSIDLAAVAPVLADAIVGDRYRLRQVLGNLVANAVKFTDRGHVVVRAATRELAGRIELRVEVADSGIGIAPDKHPRLFEPYPGVHAGADRRAEGTGLGLAISRRLVEAMGGQIGVESDSGRGSTFWFTVPLLPSPAFRLALPLRSLPPARVLLVENRSATRECLEAYLASWGIEIATVHGGAEALAALRAAAVQGRPFDAAIIGKPAADLSPEDLAGAIQTSPDLAGVALVRLRPLGEANTGTGGPWRATLRTPVHHRALRDGLGRALAAPGGPADAAESGGVRSPTLDPLHLSVLVADDDRTSQAVAALMLRALGCDADVVVNGPAAVAASASGRYDAILMDCNMPVMDGLAATGEIRRRDAGRPRTPIVAVTAAAAKLDRDQCFEAGMDDYLSKPITLETLRAALVRVSRPESLLSHRTGQASAIAFDPGGASDHAPGPGRGGSGSPSSPRPQVARLFQREAPRQLEDIKDAIARRDTAALARATHRLRGAVANFGASDALDAAQHLEAMVERSRTAPETDGIWVGREEQLERVTAAIAELLNAIAPPT